MSKNVKTCNNLRISYDWNKMNAITASHFNKPCASLKATTRLCSRCACKRVQPRNLHSLFTVGSFDTYILYHLILLKYMFLCLYYLYIYKPILRKLIYMQTWCNFKNWNYTIVLAVSGLRTIKLCCNRP
jgi:hypothetical protein